MKYIFDFDDTLFHTTKNLREKIYGIYARYGISREKVIEYIENERARGFSLKRLLKHFSLDDNLHHEIMSSNQDFVNKEILELAKKAGRENCFIVTSGDDEFQREKIKTAGLEPLFTEIVVALGSKKDAIERICEKFKNEPVIFIDDKQHFFNDLDFKKCPNLKTVLYTGQTAQKLEQEINA
jgi:HAD superfamily hydrolase (TIGR01509 family)